MRRGCRSGSVSNSSSRTGRVPRGNIATGDVAKAVPDGYTLLVAVSSNAINATFYKNLNFNFVKDIMPVGVHRLHAVRDDGDAIVPGKDSSRIHRLCESQPRQDQHGFARCRHLAAHVTGELLIMMTGIDLVHVPYRGNVVPDLISGQVQVYFSPLPQVMEFVRDGRLRALAVTSATRYRCATGCVRPLRKPCQVMRRALGTASVRRQGTPARSSTSSIRKSMLALRTLADTRSFSPVSASSQSR